MKPLGKRVSSVKTKTNPNIAVKLAEKAIIPFYCLFHNTWSKQSKQVSKQTYIPDKRNYNGWKTAFFHNNIKIKKKNNYNNSNKIWVKVFSMSEGNTCIAEPNLEVLPLTKIK